jgi:1-acyl-sn-glycerol-3-phosphate acyltransferase
VPDGPTLVVGNHSGGKIPIDVFLFGASWHKWFDYSSPLFFLVHDMLIRPIPWIRNSIRRLGGVRAARENAIEILRRGQRVMVLPGGEYETFRPYRERNRIDFGERTGFIRVALQAGAPITPVVSIGGHEIFYILTRGEGLARRLLPTAFRAQSFPIAFGLPFGLYVGPIPSPLPLPARIVNEVLPPIHLDREEADHPAFRPDDGDDPVKVRHMYKVVTSRMQAALDRLAAERRFPVIG